MKKLYFYTVDFNNAEGAKHTLTCTEVEVRETEKLYLCADKNMGFPNGLCRLPKNTVDTGSVYDGYLILTKPDEESARAVWRRHYGENADTFARRAEQWRKYAEECREIAATL